MCREGGVGRQQLMRVQMSYFVENFLNNNNNNNKLPQSFIFSLPACAFSAYVDIRPHTCNERHSWSQTRASHPCNKRNGRAHGRTPRRVSCTNGMPSFDFRNDADCAHDVTCKESTMGAFEDLPRVYPGTASSPRSPSLTVAHTIIPRMGLTRGSSSNAPKE